MPVPVPNLRDVGGMTTEDGRSVRPGRVLRSATPHSDDLVPDGIAWPPAVVVDLRSAGEREPVHPLASTGAEIVNLPLLTALRPGAARPENLAGLYRVMIDYVPDLFVRLAETVAAADGPTLVHCAAGKDRTGVSVALLLRLVGVPRDQVVADYLASLQAAAEIDARLGLIPGRAERDTLPPEYLAVPVEAIEGVLDAWDAHDGGVVGWLVAQGADPRVVEDLRATLLA